MQKYKATDGMVFDYKEPQYEEVPIDPENPDKGTKQEQVHLYAKLLYLSNTDSIENYIEVEQPHDLED